jgi:hypothetical protein
MTFAKQNVSKPTITQYGVDSSCAKMYPKMIEGAVADFVKKRMAFTDLAFTKLKTAEQHYAEMLYIAVHSDW